MLVCQVSPGEPLPGHCERFLHGLDSAKEKKDSLSPAVV